MTNPLFVQDLDTLKSLLRLSGVPSTSSDTLAILDEAILKARLSFYRRLTEQRINQLVATAYNANPTDRDGIIRALANTVEVKMVYAFLLRRLPHQWMDASGDANRRWNEEAPFRERGPTDVQRELQRLEAEIEEDMQMLGEEESLADESGFRVFDGTPSTTPPRPGDTLRRGRNFRINED